MEDGKVTHPPMIGELAPSFTGITTQGVINFPKDYTGKWVVLFGYVADFTPVCTTEFMLLASMVNEFKEIDTELIGLSTDSVYSHIAWLRKIKELAWKDVKHVDITFPLISDTTAEIAMRYEMLHENGMETQLVRAVFIIDPQGKIRVIQYYPPMIGRNIQEIKRIVTALQKADSEKAATPADWMPGEDVMLLPPQTCLSASDRIDKVNENMYCLDWFLSFKQINCITCKQESEPEPEMIPYPSGYPTRRRTHYSRR